MSGHMAQGKKYIAILPVSHPTQSLTLYKEEDARWEVLVGGRSSKGRICMCVKDAGNIFGGGEERYF